MRGRPGFRAKANEPIVRPPLAARVRRRCERAGRADPRFAPPLPAPRLTVDQAVAAALAEAPGATLASLNLPQEGPKPAWRVEVRPSGSEASRTLRVNDASGEVKAGREGGQGAGGPDPFSRWVRRLHDGTDMGLAWRLIITLAGAAPLVLSVTGLIMWLRRRARRIALRPV